MLGTLGGFDTMPCTSVGISDDDRGYGEGEGMLLCIALGMRCP